MSNLSEIALAGAVGLGAYELYHHHQYGNFGFGNPYNNGMGMGMGMGTGMGSWSPPRTSSYVLKQNNVFFHYFYCKYIKSNF
jgi:hypothetical protein